MKKILPILIVGILISTAFGAVARAGLDPIPMKTSDTVRSDYTHTVMVEVGTATWCPACPQSNSVWHTIYESGNYNFEYTEMVIDKDAVANTRMQNDYNIHWVPTSYFDGGQYVYPGTNQGTFQNYLNSCGARAVPDLTAQMNVQWLGSAQVKVDLSIENNEQTDYSGHLRVYILEKQSTRWKDYNSQWYNHAFLDFIFNQAITIPAGGTYSDSKIWDGAAHGYGDISSENIQVILAVFGNTQHQGYSDPNDDDHDGDKAPFIAYYVDETIAATPQTNNAPNKPGVPSGPTTGKATVQYTYSGNTTDPDGDNIYYMFDWGDGSNSNWLGPYASGATVTANHAWTYGGTYDVKLKAKDAAVDSPWSDPLVVQITGPNLELVNLKGGLFKVRAVIHNPGDTAISNVNWQITLHNYVFLGKLTTGENITIPANSNVTIQSSLILGIG
ncbi:MAG TPA: PKD domain-containing protein, partial [Candidatus Thermoplasmatota archaeon]|nr:PKD domain-containing protein [Candidatus Thermoplasmatota archaeon]